MTSLNLQPTDQAALRDRIADVLASADGWKWVTDLDKARSSTYRSYQSRADAVLALLPAPELAASTAPLAAGFPLVKGNCPACRRAGLFPGTGGYPTCSNADCPEPDAATTVLEQYANEARPPQHSWRVETHDPIANQWAPGSHFLRREAAVERYDTATSTAPVWTDGRPVERRIVRETTTYTVDTQNTPHADAQAPEEA